MEEFLKESETVRTKKCGRRKILVNFYGTEGIHYQRTGEKNSYEGIPSENIFRYWVGSPDELLERKKYMEDQQWAMVCQKLNEKQKLLEEVRKDYLLPLCCGGSDNIKVDYVLAIDKLYEAGLQEYLNILQEQIDNYWEDRS